MALWLALNTGAAVVLAGGGLFVLAWLFGPVDGVLVRSWRRRRAVEMMDREEGVGMTPDAPQ